MELFSDHQAVRASAADASSDPANGWFAPNSGGAVPPCRDQVRCCRSDTYERRQRRSRNTTPSPISYLGTGRARPARRGMTDARYRVAFAGADDLEMIEWWKRHWFAGVPPHVFAAFRIAVGCRGLPDDARDARRAAAPEHHGITAAPRPGVSRRAAIDRAGLGFGHRLGHVGRQLLRVRLARPRLADRNRVDVRVHRKRRADLVEHAAALRRHSI